MGEQGNGRYDTGKFGGKRYGFGNLAQEKEQTSTRWVHVPARETLTIVMLTDRAYRYVGHWVEGRMRVCPGAGCIQCATRTGEQARYAMSVYVPATRSRAFFECGPGTAEAICEEVVKLNRMRGVMLELSHQGKTKNGLILAKGAGIWPYAEQLPEAEDVEEQIDRQRAVQQARVNGQPLPRKWFADAGQPAVEEEGATQALAGMDVPRA